MCSCQGAEQANEIATISGGNDGEVPPVPIPNTAVKLSSAESTWLDTAREDKSLPDSYEPLIRESQGCFFVVGGKEKIPRANDWAQGMRLSFPMILVFSAGSRGQWKQTKSAVALWTPSPSPPMLQWERRGVGERMTDQHAGIVCRSHQPNRAEGSREGTSSRFISPLQGAGAAPLLGLGATPQLFRGRLVCPTRSTKVQAAKRPCQ